MLLNAFCIIDFNKSTETYQTYNIVIVLTANEFAILLDKAQIIVLLFILSHTFQSHLHRFCALNQYLIELPKLDIQPFHL